MKLDPTQRQELLAALAGMNAFLRAAFESLTPSEARMPGPGGAFSPVEQVWHLADLEREGFALRIARLRSETQPRLPDFDGARIAQERNHRLLSLAEGLDAFEAARNANLDTLRSLSGEAWLRSGTQDGVGTVSLCDMPGFMRQHDQAHMNEIADWTRFVGR